MNARASKVTLKDVARKAGVHHSTVSLVLSGDKRISGETRARVLDAVRELGYVPNRSAQALRRGTERLIALVLWEGAQDAPIHYEHMQAIFRTAFERGYQVLLIYADREVLRRQTLRDLVFRSNAAGAIFMGAPVNVEGLGALVESGYPFVHIGERRLHGKLLPCVSGDYRLGSFLAVTKLIELGHRRIACLVYDTYPDIADTRLAGYVDAMKTAQAEPWVRRAAPGAFRWNEVFDSLQGAGITAVYTTENNLGVSLIAEAQARGVKVPEDLSIISFDDHVQASLIRPALSVVRQPTAEIGKGAVTVLLDVVEGKEASVATKLLEPVVILRESVRRI